MTRNSSNSIQIYVNGDKSQYYVSKSDGYDDVLYIGRDPNQGEYLDGSMDEIAIWSKELSAAQIDSLYNKGVPQAATKILGGASSLQSYWKLEQSTGTTAANSVTNGAALTLNNGPTWGQFKQSPIPEIMYNIRSGSQSSYPEEFIEYNGKIYFKADDGSYGSEMWEYDPTADASSSNPKRISDIRTGGSGKSGVSWTDHWLVWNNKLYFVGNDGSYGDELYSYDGSSFTRITDIYSGSNGSSPNYLTVYNDKLYFSAYNNTYGTELYVYDGSTVSLVKDYASGSSSGFGWGGMVVYNNKLYYQGYSESTGYELYSYDGTDISLVKDISPGTYTSGDYTYTNNGYPSDFLVYDNKLFFKAEDKTIGGELFYYDGTDVTGIDIYTGSTTSGSSSYLNGSWPYSFTVYKSVLYFQARDATYGSELWGYDATTNAARLIKDIAPGSYTSGSSTYKNSSYPNNLTVFDNKLYFSAEDGYNVRGRAGGELWYYDGNNAGRAADIYPGTNGSYPYEFFATTDKMYFRAQASSTGSEPYILTSRDPFPSIASVTSTTSNDTYKSGSTINITVNFSEAVTLGGTMTVTLETGTTDQTVSIPAFSSATSASGTYTVVAGDESSDLTVKSIAVSGTISDASDQIMEDFSIGSNLASSSAIVVDGVNPTVASVKSTSTNTTYGTGASINVTVNFSEAVSLSSGGSMTVTLETGDTDRTVSITSISNDTSASGTYTVQDLDASFDLDVKTIALASGSLTDAAGNAMSSFTIPSGNNLSDNNAIVINTAKPSTPTGFVVSSNYGSVGLAWTAISSAEKYKVYKRKSSSSDFSLLSDTITINSYNDTTFGGDLTRYYYYVMSVNNLGDSSPSDTLYGYPSKIWYVEIGGSDSEDGKSKAKAFATIEKAVKNNSSLASGDTIYVGPSISSSKSRDDTGGYYDFVGLSGGITVPSSKDFVLIGTSGADSTIFNAKHGNRHFTFDNGPTAATKIIGITFYKGKRSSGYDGGSISIRGSNTKLEFINCVFDDNRVVNASNEYWSGGAIGIRDEAAPSFTGCTFKNNYIESSESGVSAGAVFINSSYNQNDLENTINFKQCKFISNYAKGKQHTRGGAVLSYRNTLFENCLFVKNGAIAGYGQSSSTYESAYGGAIYSNGEQGTIGIITVVANCTFDSNYVEVLTNSGWTKAADIFYGQGSGQNTTKYAYVFNSVITGSYVKGGSPSNSNAEYKKDKVFHTDDTQNRIYVDYSTIESSSGISWAANENVFEITPVYKNAANLDYSLSDLSPVIGKGTSTYKNYNAPSIDILGAARPSSNPDMGAYENSLANSTAPLPITNLVGTAKTNSASLSWSAIKSSLGGNANAANIKYLIYQDGSQVATSTSTGSTVTNLTNGTTYTFSVAAQDTITSLIGAPSTAVSVTPVYSGPYWYVAASNGNAPGYSDNNLGSKDIPLDGILSAVQLAATGDTIVMLKGTHTGTDNINIDGFSNKSLVVMGDPEYGAESTIIDASGSGRHFKFDSGEDSTNQVIGLTLYNGKMTGSNSNSAGGSVYIYNSNPVFKKVIFKQNKDEVDTWSGGGAVFIDQSSEAKFYQCVFDGNIMDRTSTTNNTNASGGAVGLNRTSAQSSSYVLFDGCTFKNNVAKGSARTTGGALYIYNSQVKILNSLFYNNTAHAAVGGQNNNGAYGSAISVSGPSYRSGNEDTGGDVQIINCTIVNNKVKSGSSSYQSSDDEAMAVILESWDRSEKIWFFNNIVWGNQSENGKTDRQVVFWNEQGWSSRYLNYNVIQNSADLTQYTSSFETDPTFADSVNGDYSLANSSSLIGKGGSNFKNVNAPTTDLLGVARPSPSGSDPDIGAYENGLSTTPYPGAVTNLTAIGGSGSVTLQWNTVADADSAYKVYKRDGEAFSVAAAYYLGATSAKTVPHDTTYTITGLDNTKRYYFRVAAVNKEGYEGTSAALDITPTYSGPVWWVSTTGNDDTGDGGTGKPFKTLKHAIGHVTAGDTVKLKKGTHTGVGNYGIAITTNSPSAVIDFANLKNVVITSEEGAASTFIQANDQGRHFTISGNRTQTIDSTFQIIGLTFTGGKRSDYGGSVFIRGEAYPNPNNTQQRLTSHMQPKFKDCVFKDNQVMSNNGGHGGAVYIENAAPIFESCVFDSNYANGAGGAVDIGGEKEAGGDTVWVYKSTFKNNWVDDDGMSNKISTNGGAINLRHGMLIIIANSTFEKNMVIAKNSDYGSYGGAISINRDWDTKNRPLLHIKNSRFTKNINRTEFGWNAQGGAIYAGAPFALYNTVIDSNTAESTAQNGRGVGGGLFVDIGAYWDENGNQIQGNSYLINNTIADNYVSGQGNNESGESGGVHINHGNEGSGTWFNNIFWGNRSDASETSRHNLSMHEANTFLIAADYNNVEFSENYGYIMGSNSYDLHPSFYSATNYQLSGGSPLIGAGVSSFNGITGPAYDILDNTRPNPSGSNPDLGAYENALAESPYPKQVKNLVGTFGSSQVSLSWDANTETDIAKYIVYASTVKDFTPAQADKVGETTTTAYTVTGLTNNTEYHFRVSAVDKTDYEGSYSAQVSVIPKYDGPIWWVSAEGQTLSDGSKEFPFDNITSALEQINVGDTIYLEPGEHHSPGSRGIDVGDQYPEFYIHGSTGDPKDVILNGNYETRHFSIRNSKAGFKHITFARGNATENTIGGGGGGGSFRIGPGDNTKVTFDNCIFYRNQTDGSGWAGGGAILVDNIKEISFTNCVFRENRVESGTRGGAVYIYADQSDGQNALSLFDHCRFISNGVEKGNSDNQEHLAGGALVVGGYVIIQNSIIDSNYVYHNYGGTGEIVGAHGGAVSISFAGNNQDLSNWNDVPYSIFSSNIVSNTRVRVTGSVDGGYLRASTKIKMENNLIINNSISSDINQNGWDIRGGVLIEQWNSPAPPMAFINNTVAYNSMQQPSSGSNAYVPGLMYSHNNDTGENAAVIGNNIIHSNQGYMDNDDYDEWGPSGDNNGIAHLYNNLIGESGKLGTDPVGGRPNFKNPSNGNYQLSMSSAAIDAGALSFTGGFNAPIKDIRDYYRVGTPDLGAYEAGASKYILVMADDIAEGERDFSGDTTFVKFSQKLKFTVTTGDIEGNVVSSNEPVTWNVFPNQKYARVAAGANDNTESGTASATIDVTDQTKGKGFRFRVVADIGDAFLRSNIYVIDELVTGAPPPVVNLTISPSDWTNNPNFTISWETPSWIEDRDYIGAIVEITDGINKYNQYLDFAGGLLTNYTFAAPEAGQFDASLRLIDELGNEDPDSSRSVTAYFDDIMPEEFDLHWPDSSGTEIEYTSDMPQFHWHAKDDYPSGIKEWRLFLKEGGAAYAFNYAYTGSDVTTDENYDDRHVDHAGTPLNDGYYNWYVEAVDQAGNVRFSSDSAYFGVDLNPPRITHNNPLTIVDENTTSPAINVSFDDSPGSGVMWGRLNYRRSGSGGGFVAVDLLLGPVNIPGSDIKAEGLEYYIDTEDNVGNRGFWPSDTTFHSVRVRSENNITTADRWSSGIPGGTDSTNYLFFSIPFEVSGAKSAITSVMGPPDEFNYRLYAYNNGWQENPSSVTMGNAYFFIFDPDKYPDNPNLSFDFGEGVSTPTDPPYGVNVSSGQWKFFGSPYNFNVSLDNVYTEDGTNVRDAGSIYTWGGSWSSVSTLQPWRGYIFKSGGATKLNIDGRGGNFGKLAKAFDPDNVAMDAAEWTVNIIATTGNARDELNAVGVRHMAKDGYDKLDEFEPPAVPGDIVLRIDNRDREESPDLYAIDIRKPNEKGHYWDLQVFTPTNGNRTYITFDGLGYIPQEYDVFLINKTTQQAKNLEWESSYRFANTGSDRYLQQDLRLVIGTKDFVNENNAGVNLYPDAFTLSQNYPNPFNPQTSIMISLEEDAQVDLVIYNLLGEQITRLAINENRPAGYYTFIWNGTNDVGRKVSTGVYFYHAMIKNSQGRVVLNKTRKMIFLK